MVRVDEALDRIRHQLFQFDYSLDDVQISPDHTRAFCKLSRGNLYNIICCPMLAMCFCPYNNWTLKVWSDGQAIRYELGKAESHCCVHFCFSGVAGLAVQEQQFNTCKQLIHRALTNGMDRTNNIYRAPPTQAFTSQYTSPPPFAAAPMERVIPVATATAYADNDPPPSYDFSVAMAVPVADSSVNFSAAPMYQAPVLNAWLQQEDNKSHY